MNPVVEEFFVTLNIDLLIQEKEEEYSRIEKSINYLGTLSDLRDRDFLKNLKVVDYFKTQAIANNEQHKIYLKILEILEKNKNIQDPKIQRAIEDVKSIINEKLNNSLTYISASRDIRSKDENRQHVKLEKTLTLLQSLVDLKEGKIKTPEDEKLLEDSINFIETLTYQKEIGGLENNRADFGNLYLKGEAGILLQGAKIEARNIISLISGGNIDTKDISASKAFYSHVADKTSANTNEWWIKGAENALVPTYLSAPKGVLKYYIEGDLKDRGGNINAKKTTAKIIGNLTFQPARLLKYLDFGANVGGTATGISAKVGNISAGSDQIYGAKETNYSSAKDGVRDLKTTDTAKNDIIDEISKNENYNSNSDWSTNWAGNGASARLGDITENQHYVENKEVFVNSHLNFGDAFLDIGGNYDGAGGNINKGKGTSTTNIEAGSQTHTQYKNTESIFRNLDSHFFGLMGKASSTLVDIAANRTNEEASRDKGYQRSAGLEVASSIGDVTSLFFGELANANAELGSTIQRTKGNTKTTSDNRGVIEGHFHIRVKHGDIYLKSMDIGNADGTSDISLIADTGKLTIEYGKTESTSDLYTLFRTANIGANASVVPNAVGAGLSGSYSQREEITKESSTVHNDSKLIANNLNIRTKGDAVIEGAAVHSYYRNLDIGGKLILLSKQNFRTMDHTVWGFSLSGGVASNSSSGFVPIPTASISYTYGKDHDYSRLTESISGFWTTVADDNIAGDLDSTSANFTMKDGKTRIGGKIKYTKLEEFQDKDGFLTTVGGGVSSTGNPTINITFMALEKRDYKAETSSSTNAGKGEIIAEGGTSGESVNEEKDNRKVLKDEKRALQNVTATLGNPKGFLSNKLAKGAKSLGRFIKSNRNSSSSKPSSGLNKNPNIPIRNTNAETSDSSGNNRNVSTLSTDGSAPGSSGLTGQTTDVPDSKLLSVNLDQDVSNSNSSSGSSYKGKGKGVGKKSDPSKTPKNTEIRDPSARDGEVEAAAREAGQRRTTSTTPDAETENNSRLIRGDADPDSAESGDQKQKQLTTDNPEAKTENNLRFTRGDADPDSTGSGDQKQKQLTTDNPEAKTENNLRFTRGDADPDSTGSGDQKQKQLTTDNPEANNVNRPNGDNAEDAGSENVSPSSSSSKGKSKTPLKPKHLSYEEYSTQFGNRIDKGKTAWVFESPQNSNKAMKYFSRKNNFFASRKQLKQALAEAEGFRKYYGEDSVEVITHNGNVALRMNKIPGVKLTDLPEGALPPDAPAKFLDMVSRMKVLGVLKNLDPSNVLYDSNTNQFYPLSMAQGRSNFFKANSRLRAFSIKKQNSFVNKTLDIVKSKLQLASSTAENSEAQNALGLYRAMSKSIQSLAEGEESPEKRSLFNEMLDEVDSLQQRNKADVDPYSDVLDAIKRTAPNEETYSTVADALNQAKGKYVKVVSRKNSDAEDVETTQKQNRETEENPYPEIDVDLILNETTQSPTQQKLNPDDPNNIYAVSNNNSKSNKDTGQLAETGETVKKSPANRQTTSNTEDSNLDVSRPVNTGVVKAGSSKQNGGVEDDYSTANVDDVYNPQQNRAQTREALEIKLQNKPLNVSESELQSYLGDAFSSGYHKHTKGSNKLVKVYDREDFNSDEKMFIRADQDLTAYKSIYGPGAGKVVTDGKKIALLIGKPVGEKLSSIPRGKLPAKAVEKFVRMINDMKTKGFDIEGFTADNIIYNKKTNRFSPISLVKRSSSTDINEGEATARALLSYVKNRVDKPEGEGYRKGFSKNIPNRLQRKVKQPAKTIFEDGETFDLIDESQVGLPNNNNNTQAAFKPPLPPRNNSKTDIIDVNAKDPQQKTNQTAKTDGASDSLSKENTRRIEIIELNANNPQQKTNQTAKTDGASDSLSKENTRRIEIIELNANNPQQKTNQTAKTDAEAANQDSGQQTRGTGNRGGDDADTPEQQHKVHSEGGDEDGLLDNTGRRFKDDDSDSDDDTASNYFGLEDGESLYPRLDVDEGYGSNTESGGSINSTRNKNDSNLDEAQQSKIHKLDDGVELVDDFAAQFMQGSGNTAYYVSKTDPGRLLKSYGTGSNISHAAQEDIDAYKANILRIALEDLDAYQQYYGANVGRIVADQYNYALELPKPPGKTLSDIKGNLPLDAEAKFQQLVNDLKSKGLATDDLGPQNVTYDAETNKFYPTDIRRAQNSVSESPSSIDVETRAINYTLSDIRGKINNSGTTAPDDGTPNQNKIHTLSTEEFRAQIDLSLENGYYLSKKNANLLLKAYDPRDPQALAQAQQDLADYQRVNLNNAGRIITDGKNLMLELPKFPGNPIGSWEANTVYSRATFSFDHMIETLTRLGFDVTSLDVNNILYNATTNKFSPEFLIRYTGEPGKNNLKADVLSLVESKFRLRETKPVKAPRVGDREYETSGSQNNSKTDIIDVNANNPQQKTNQTAKTDGASDSLSKENTRRIEIIELNKPNPQQKTNQTAKTDGASDGLSKENTRRIEIIELNANNPQQKTNQTAKTDAEAANQDSGQQTRGTGNRGGDDADTLEQQHKVHNLDKNIELEDDLGAQFVLGGNGSAYYISKKDPNLLLRAYGAGRNVSHAPQDDIAAYKANNLRRARQDLDAYQQYYGANVGRIVGDQYNYALELPKPPGKTLSDIKGNLPLDAEAKFQQLVNDLKSKGLATDDLGPQNVTYDAETNKFYPTDIRRAQNSVSESPSSIDVETRAINYTLSDIRGKINNSGTTAPDDGTPNQNKIHTLSTEEFQAQIGNKLKIDNSYSLSLTNDSVLLKAYDLDYPQALAQARQDLADYKRFYLKNAGRIITDGKNVMLELPQGAGIPINTSGLMVDYSGIDSFSHMIRSLTRLGFDLTGLEPRGIFYDAKTNKFSPAILIRYTGEPGKNNLKAGVFSFIMKRFRPQETKPVAGKNREYETFGSQGGTDSDSGYGSSSSKNSTGSEKRTQIKSNHTVKTETPKDFQEQLGTAFSGNYHLSKKNPNILLKVYDSNDSETYEKMFSRADRELTAYKSIYGPKAGHIITYGDKVALLVGLLPGKKLSKIERGNLPAKAIESFIEMIDNLKRKGFDVEDFNADNILYDKKTNRFSPISLVQRSSDTNIEAGDATTRALLHYIKNRTEKPASEAQRKWFSKNITEKFRKKANEHKNTRPEDESDYATLDETKIAMGNDKQKTPPALPQRNNISPKKTDGSEAGSSGSTQPRTNQQVVSNYDTPDVTPDNLRHYVIPTADLDAALGDQVSEVQNGRLYTNKADPNLINKVYTVNPEEAYDQRLSNAQQEVNSFIKYYGEDSATLITDGTRVAAITLKIDGTPLKDLNPGDLPAGSDQKYLNMIARLMSAEIFHEELNTSNILYDKATNEFYPINFTGKKSTQLQENEANTFYQRQQFETLVADIRSKMQAPAKPSRSQNNEEAGIKDNRPRESVESNNPNSGDTRPKIIRQAPDPLDVKIPNVRHYILSEADFNDELGDFISQGQRRSLFTNKNDPEALTRLYKINLNETYDQRLLKAQLEANGFIKYYGKNSAQVITDGVDVAVVMIRAPGIPLKDLKPGDLPFGSDQKYLDMINRLSIAKVFHEELNTSNILYDKATNEFYPINFPISKTTKIPTHEIDQFYTEFMKTGRFNTIIEDVKSKSQGPAKPSRETGSKDSTQDGPDDDGNGPGGSRGAPRQQQSLENKETPAPSSLTGNRDQTSKNTAQTGEAGASQTTSQHQMRALSVTEFQADLGDSISPGFHINRKSAQTLFKVYDPKDPQALTKAQQELEVYKTIYGDKAGQIITYGDNVAIEIETPPGQKLSTLRTLPANAEEIFVKTLNNLRNKGIDVENLNADNIFYDASTNAFFPISLVKRLNAHRIPLLYDLDTRKYHTIPALNKTESDGDVNTVLSIIRGKVQTSQNRGFFRSLKDRVKQSIRSKTKTETRSSSSSKGELKTNPPVDTDENNNRQTKQNSGLEDNADTPATGSSNLQPIKISTALLNSELGDQVSEVQNGRLYTNKADPNLINKVYTVNPQETYDQRLINAQKEVSGFIKFYGVGSAQIMTDGVDVAVVMIRAPGTPLKDLNPGDLPAGSDQKYLNMIARLMSAEIFHEELNTSNILYDKATNEFYPINFTGKKSTQLQNQDVDQFYTEFMKTGRFNTIIEDVKSKSQGPAKPSRETGSKDSTQDGPDDDGNGPGGSRGAPRQQQSLENKGPPKPPRVENNQESSAERSRQLAETQQSHDTTNDGAPQHKVTPVEREYIEPVGVLFEGKTGLYYIGKKNPNLLFKAYDPKDPQALTKAQQELTDYQKFNQNNAGRIIETSELILLELPKISGERLSKIRFNTLPADMEARIAEMINNLKTQGFETKHLNPKNISYDPETNKLSPLELVRRSGDVDHDAENRIANKLLSYIKNRRRPETSNTEDSNPQKHRGAGDKDDDGSGDASRKQQSLGNQGPPKPPRVQNNQESSAERNRQLAETQQSHDTESRQNEALQNNVRTLSVAEFQSDVYSHLIGAVIYEQGSTYYLSRKYPERLVKIYEPYDPEDSGAYKQSYARAEEDLAAYKAFYGENSGGIVADGVNVALMLSRPPGQKISTLRTLSPDAEASFAEMVNYLKNKGLSTETLNPDNILYDAKTNKFSPISPEKRTSEVESKINVNNVLSEIKHRVNSAPTDASGENSERTPPQKNANQGGTEESRQKEKQEGSEGSGNSGNGGPNRSGNPGGSGGGDDGDGGPGRPGRGGDGDDDKGNGGNRQPVEEDNYDIRRVNHLKFRMELGDHIIKNSNSRLYKKRDFIVKRYHSDKPSYEDNLKRAKNEISNFRKYYDDGDSDLIMTDGKNVAVLLYNLQGVPLSKIKAGELHPDAEAKFMEVIGRLKELGMKYDHISPDNILYDTKKGWFYPTDLEGSTKNSSPSYLEALTDIKNKIQKPAETEKKGFFNTLKDLVRKEQKPDEISFEDPENTSKMELRQDIKGSKSSSTEEIRQPVRQPVTDTSNESPDGRQKATEPKTIYEASADTANLIPVLPLSKSKFDAKLGDPVYQGANGNLHTNKNNPDMITKLYTNIPGETYDQRLSRAQQDMSDFTKYYGEDSVQIITDRTRVGAVMLKVPGVALKNLKPGDLPPDAEEKYLNMVARLIDYKIFHEELNSSNILYDKETNQFHPINFTRKKSTQLEPNDVGKFYQKQLLDILTDDVKPKMQPPRLPNREDDDLETINLDNDEAARSPQPVAKENLHHITELSNQQFKKSLGRQIINEKNSIIYEKHGNLVKHYKTESNSAELSYENQMARAKKEISNFKKLYGEQEEARIITDGKNVALMLYSVQGVPLSKIKAGGLPMNAEAKLRTMIARLEKAEIKYDHISSDNLFYDSINRRFHLIELAEPIGYSAPGYMGYMDVLTEIRSKKVTDEDPLPKRISSLFNYAKKILLDEDVPPPGSTM